MNRGHELPPAHPIDSHVGRRVRELRHERGIDQSTCATAAEISIERFQLCECGSERLRVGELFRLARFLDVRISAFFHGLDQTLSNP